MAGPFIPVPREEDVLDKFGSAKAFRGVMLCQDPHAQRPTGPSAVNQLIGWAGFVILKPQSWQLHCSRITGS